MVLSIYWFWVRSSEFWGIICAECRVLSTGLIFEAKTQYPALSTQNQRLQVVTFSKKAVD